MVHPAELRTHNSHRTQLEDEGGMERERTGPREPVWSPTIDMGGSPTSTYPTPVSAGPSRFVWGRGAGCGRRLSELPGGEFCHELSTVRNHRCE